MGRIRYALLLPLAHFLITGIVLYQQDSGVWKYIPRMERLRDAERARGEQFDWYWNCYEYHPPMTVRFLIYIEAPAGWLIGPSGAFQGCIPGALSPVLHRLGDRLSVKEGFMVTDLLLLTVISIQWFLVGYWLNSVRSDGKTRLRVLAPTIVISVCGLFVAMVCFSARERYEVVSLILCFTALVFWQVLLMVLGVDVATFTFRRIHRRVERPV